ncbi:unnamed protein product [Arabidopsis arenosa]|uniref:Uncharacterized protein n=1 Tax=Arabidopsis arenosa TaxID=38785 RepID=A0A8S2AW13_ARAAE|nr:unnamed protein product [Arabidopsis arenosa]
MQMMQVQPRMMPQSQMQMMPYANSMQKANAVAHVYTENGYNPSDGYLQMPMSMNGSYGTLVPQYAPPVIQDGNTQNLQDYSPQQIGQMVSQFQAQVQVSEPVTSSSTPSPIANITEHGLMAHTSTSGTFSGLDDWEG